MQEAISALYIGMTFYESKGIIENIHLQPPKKVAAGEQTLPEMTKLALLISAYINKAATDEELKKVLTQQITEALSESASYNPSGFAKMQIIFQAQIQDPKQIISALLDQLKQAAAAKDASKVSDLIPRLLCAERILRAVNATTSAQVTSATATPRQNLEDIYQKGGNISDDDFAELIAATQQLEEAIYGSTTVNEEELQDSEISDKVMDLNQEVTSLLTSIIMDVKKATDADIPEITKNIEILKSKAIEIATTTLQGAVRRGSKIPKEDTEALTDEISKLLESIIAFQNGAAESLSLFQTRQQ